MNYQYYIQYQAYTHYLFMNNNKVDDFEIDSAYLVGISKADFIQGYHELYDIVKEYYHQISIDPVSFNLPLVKVDETKSTEKEVRDGVWSLMWFPVLILASAYSTFQNVDYFCNLDEFKATLKNHRFKNLDSHINFLIKKGFVFTNWTGKQFKKAEYFKLQYPKCNHIFKVIEALGKKMRKVERRHKVFDINTHIQFMYLMPSLFKDTSEDLDPVDIKYFTNILNKDDEAFVLGMHQLFLQYGLVNSFDANLKRIHYLNEKGKDTLNYFEFYDYHYPNHMFGRVRLRLKLNNIDSYQDYIDQLPEPIKEQLAKTLCQYGSPSCNRRLTYSVDGKTMDICGSNNGIFELPHLQDLSYYKQLFILESKARKQW